MPAWHCSMSKNEVSSPGRSRRCENYATMWLECLPALRVFHAMSHGKRMPLCGHVGCIHVKMPGLTRVQHKTKHVDGSFNPQQSCMKTMTCTRNASGYRFSFGKHLLNRLKRLEQRNPLAYIQHDLTLNLMFHSPST